MTAGRRVAHRPEPGGPAERLLLLDFDGTVYRGDEPVLGYARAVAERLPRAAGVRLTEVIAQFCRTGSVPTGVAARRPEDGWDAVGLVASGLGADPGAVAGGFSDTRRAMLDGRYALRVPSGLRDLLRSCRGGAGAVRCRVALASNSPASSVGPLLERLGLAGEFDAVLADSGKPDGLLAAARTALPGVAAANLLSVGDHYRNDIAPAAAVGAATGYLNPYRLPDRPATFTSPDLEHLYPDVLAWCAGAGRQAEGMMR